ncbi:MAG: hypothetical protein LC098_10590 [Burkholderiales bacterium]|uniref:hypothetical protein n=1 Tax=Dokdonella sp. TaxID=2291710 RepID=UPI0027BA6789|nr:hypothetical protein [Dokdonella sp.]MCZ2135856.1 hypothetical protein [Burkholderiales bacterium]
MAKQQQSKTKQQQQPSKGGESERYNVLSPYQYENHEGEKKTAWTDVGVAFMSKDKVGVNVEIRPGLSVSGRLVLRPWKRKDDEQDEGPKRFVHDANGGTEGLV